MSAFGLFRSVPSAPAPIASEPVFTRLDYLAFTVLTAINAAAIGGFALYWMRLDGWATSVVLWLATAVIVRNLSIHQMRWFTLLLMRRPLPRPARPGWRVAAVTTFVPEYEPLEMLEQTVEALVAMDYPHDVWVLDEGDDERVRALCRRLGAHHFSRRNRPDYQTKTGTFQTRSKHGNYNAWLHEHGFESYDLIAAFDPDHVPRPHFLTSVLGYFEDPEVGYVQAPQAYYNQKASFIARGAAEETYAYYSSIQMAYHGLGHPVVTGCHQTHRAAALHAVGGFAAHEADDLLLTLHYRAAGWKGVYVPQILARGLTPVDWAGYLTQQRRWARSVLDIKFRHYPRLAGRMVPLDRLVSLLHGLYYLQGLTALLALAVLLYIQATGHVPGFITYTTGAYAVGLLLILRLTDFYRQRFFLDRRAEWGVLWRASVLQLAKWPFLLIAFVDAVRGRKSSYVITPKIGTPERPYLLVWPHLLILLLLAAALVIGLMTGRGTDPSILAWTALTAFTSGLFIWSETRAFPAPYDRSLYPG